MIHYLYRTIFTSLSVFVVSLLLSGCSSDELFSDEFTSGHGVKLKINVSNGLNSKVGGLITGSLLPNNSSLGVFVTNKSDGSAYTANSSNVQFTSSASGSNQLWSTSTSVELTQTHASVYAYYPYKSTASDLSDIPVDVSENKDVMYATPVHDIYDANPTARLNMKHALAMMSFMITKGDYTGACAIDSITVQGSCLAPSGSLDAKTGVLTPSQSGAVISFGDLGSDTNISTEAKKFDQFVVPTAVTGSITISVRMDGLLFQLSTDEMLIDPSKIYKFSFHLSDGKLKMSSVNVEAFTDVVNEGLTVFRYVDPAVLKANFSSVITDGVYAIDFDGQPVPYSTAASSSERYYGVALVVKNNVYQISNYTTSTYWWKSGYSDISELTNYKYIGDPSVGNKYYGYLTGTYTPQINHDYTTWADGALADFDGYANTETIINTIGETTANTLAKTVVDFRNGISNQGFQDWYVPSEGQLACLFLNREEVSTLLKKCVGGADIPSSYHYSSTEYSSSSVWITSFNASSLPGRVDYYSKTYDYYVRFFRNIALNTRGPWSGKPDGVYGIDADGKPLTYEEASAASSLSGVAIVMYGRALQISNTQPSKAPVWGRKVNISGIPEVTQTGGGVTNSYGSLPQPNGNYETSEESEKIKQPYTAWPNYPNTALADTAGWSHTEVLIADQISSIAISGATKTFRDSSSDSTWFVPAAGQLAYIYLNVTNINTLLQKVPGATQISTSSYYWSSSEFSVDAARMQNFRNGFVSNGVKSDSYLVRFCRDITE